MRYQIGWFSSGRGPGSRALLTTVNENITNGKIKANISFVFCNRELGQSAETDKFLNLVESFKIPLVSVSSRNYKPELRRENINEWRIEYDKEVVKNIRKFTSDLSVLAGYMLIVGKEMCQHYKMINLHPAAPWGPAGTWKEVIWELIEKDASETGVMMHFVTPELDKGPPVTYCTFSIRGKHFDNHWDDIKGKTIEKIQTEEGENNLLFKAIRKYGFVREHPLIVSTTQAFSEGKVRIENDNVVDRNGKSIDSYDLTKKIDEILTAEGLI